MFRFDYSNHSLHTSSIGIDVFMHLHALEHILTRSFTTRKFQKAQPSGGPLEPRFGTRTQINDCRPAYFVGVVLLRHRKTLAFRLDHCLCPKIDFSSRSLHCTCKHRHSAAGHNQKHRIPCNKQRVCLYW